MTVVLLPHLVAQIKVGCLPNKRTPIELTRNSLSSIAATGLSSKWNWGRPVISRAPIINPLKSSRGKILRNGNFFQSCNFEVPRKSRFVLWRISRAAHTNRMDIPVSLHNTLTRVRRTTCSDEKNFQSQFASARNKNSKIRLRSLPKTHLSHQ